MKAARYVRSGSMAYMGIMAQVQAEREATNEFYSTRIASCNNGAIDVHRTNAITVRYVMRLSPRYTRAWATYLV